MYVVTTHLWPLITPQPEEKVFITANHKQHRLMKISYRDNVHICLEDKTNADLRGLGRICTRISLQPLYQSVSEQHNAIMQH